MMDRRLAIKKTSFLLGAALYSGTMAGLMAGCKAEKNLNWNPVFFSEDEVLTLTKLVDTILPKTGTPSASEVGVPEYIDDVIGNFWSPDYQKYFMDGLDHVNQIALNEGGDTYHKLNEIDQQKVMDKLVEEARDHLGSGRPFFRQLKELTYSGYFSSEVIGEQVLAYDPVPGEFIGDLPVSEADKAWSL